MKCPHCGKNQNTDFFKSRIRFNVENYGGSTFFTRCQHCKQMIGVPAFREVRIGEPYKSSETEETWG